MGRKATIKILAWHPRSAIYRRADGTTWIRLSQSTHARVEQKGRSKHWTVMGEIKRIQVHELDEEVEVIWE